MSERTDALRYAREMLDVTWRHGQAPAVADELETIVLAARDYADAVRPLFHPLVPKASKLATIRAFTSKAGVSKPTAVLLEALVQFHALHLLGDDRHGVPRAPEQEAGRRAREGDDGDGAAGRQGVGAGGAAVGADRAAGDASDPVDPAIIGGVVTQIDSTVYDGSVTRQLARMRQKLVENV